MFKVFEKDTAESTILWAKEYLESSNLSSYITAFIAGEQTKGKGKYGSIWVSEKGNLYLSFFIQEDTFYDFNNIDDLSIFSLLVGISLKEAIDSFVKTALVKCKWPNDVLVNNKKIAGILIEKIIYKNKPILLVSMGVNLKNSPKLMGRETASIKEEFGVLISPITFCNSALKVIADNIKLPKADIINKFNNYSYKLNESIKVKIGESVKTGIFKGINDKGALIIDIDGKEEKIVTGEVFD